MVDIHNRVRELRMVKGSDLRANPNNYKVHPTAQKDTFKAILEEVGFVGAVVARETENGLELLDGHMRSDLAADQLVPTLIVELTDEEADRVLATFDPVGSLAEAEKNKLRELIERTANTDYADIRRLMTQLERDSGILKEDREAGIDENTPDLSEDERKADVEGMALEPHEHYDYIVILCSTTQEWNILCEKLALTGPARQRRGKLGLSRAVPASKLLQVFAALARQAEEGEPRPETPPEAPSSPSPTSKAARSRKAASE